LNNVCIATSSLRQEIFVLAQLGGDRWQLLLKLFFDHLTHGALQNVVSLPQVLFVLLRQKTELLSLWRWHPR
jgi:hypothetical protein